MRQPRDERIPVVVLGVGMPALEVARSLGRRGIEVIGVDWRANWVSRSRYLARTIVPPQHSEAELLRILLDLGERRGNRPLLMPLKDGYVLFVSRHREQLSRCYRFLMPSADIVEGVVSKRGLWELCREMVPMPATHCLGPSDDLRELAPRLSYPCIIKPSITGTGGWSELPMVTPEQKAIEITSPRQLLEVGAVVAEHCGDIIIQEVIPGPERNLHYVVAYLDHQGRPAAAFVGRKLRTCPPHFGNGTYVESVHAPEAARQAIELLQRLGYRGCGGVEFKLDPRDGTYKLIEINARFGLWDGFAASCGIDVAFLAYADALGRPLPSLDGYRAGRRWMQFDRDFWMVLKYMRAGELTLAGWIGSLLRCRVFAPAAWDDPMPWLALNSVFARHVLAAGFGRLAGRTASDRRPARERPVASK
jgi:predicted ATP-grasp superfamily ATP-dependent carboligase